MRSFVRSVSVLGALFVAAACATADEVEHFRPLSAAEDADILYSSMVRGDDLLFLSGVLGFDPETRALGEGVEAQTTLAMNAITKTLARADADLDDLVQCTLYLADMDDYAAVNVVYGGYFGRTAPARTTIAVAALPLDAAIEIACIAAAPEED